MGNGNNEFSGNGRYNTASSDIMGSYIYAGNGEDVINMNYYETGTVVHSGSGNDIISYAEHVRLGGGGDARVFGGGGDDTINAGSGDDRLFGDGAIGKDLVDAGNDTINGGAGEDFIHAGAGDDIVNGDDGNDILYGDEGNDILRGGEGKDTLRGGDGDDTLYGDGGRDHLYGGDGADTFALEGATAFDDLVFLRDFDMSEGDSIDITDVLSGFDAGAGDDINDFVMFREAAGDSFMWVDTNGFSTDGGDLGIVSRIMDVTGLDVDVMVGDGSLIV